MGWQRRKTPRHRYADDEPTLVRAHPSEPSGVVAAPSSLAVERAKRRDPRAIDAFVRHHERGLFGFFAGPMHWHPVHVADLVQETLTRAVQGFPGLRGTTDEQAARWLYGIARKVHLQEVTRQVGARLRRDLASELAHRAERVHEPPCRRHELLAALAELPLPQLEALRLVLSGLSTREIADALGVPEGTVASRVHRARSQLRERLGLEC